MDWSKAKTIIIVAFLITNMLLVYMIVEDNPISDPTLNKSFINKAEALLEEENIGIKTEIPKKVPKLNTITVNYEDISVDSVNKKFLDNNGSVNVLEDETILEYKDEKIVLKDREIKYTNMAEEEKLLDLDKELALEESRNFLLNKGYSVEDISERYISEEDGIYYLEYSKIHNDVFVEKTYTRFKIDKRGVFEFERLWLDVKDEGDKEIYIATAPKAVLALLGRSEFKNKNIVDISLCYYFDSRMEDFLDDPVDSIEGRAVPAWRIEFSDGNKFIVDEY